jgi:signal transduction histidine kinase
MTSILPKRLFSRWSLGNAGVIAAAVLFLVTALALSATAGKMLTLRAKADQAEAVLHECGILVEELGNINAAARSFVTSRQPKLLVQREKAKPHVATSFAHLRALVAEHPIQKRMVEDAMRLSYRRLALFDQMVAHVGPPGTLVLEGEGERLKATQGNNAQFSALRDWAESSFQHYQEGLAKEMRLSMFLALFSAIASPIFGLVGIHLLKRDREDLKARELQLELMHVQRLAMMGETSAMLAHEINQPLAAASNYVSVLRRLVDPAATEKSGSVIDLVEKQIQRATTILKKLRCFIDKRETERCLETPDMLVDDAITLLGTIDSTIILKTEIAPNLPRVLVDRVQVQQVLVNLMRNAIEAMQGSAQRALVLSLTYAGGNTVEVALADTGPGLSAEVAERLFQPFVSTKASGMGVGLSICQSIVSQHGGRIWAEANPAGGTIFRFTLPVAEVRVAAE